MVVETSLVMASSGAIALAEYARRIAWDRRRKAKVQREEAERRRIQAVVSRELLQQQQAQQQEIRRLAQALEAARAELREQETAIEEVLQGRTAALHAELEERDERLALKDRLLAEWQQTIVALTRRLEVRSLELEELQLRLAAAGKEKAALQQAGLKLAVAGEAPSSSPSPIVSRASLRSPPQQHQHQLESLPGKPWQPEATAPAALAVAADSIVGGSEAEMEER